MGKNSPLVSGSLNQNSSMVKVVSAEEAAVPTAGTSKALPGVLKGSEAAAPAQQHTSRNRRSPEGFRALVFEHSP